VTPRCREPHPHRDTPTVAVTQDGQDLSRGSDLRDQTQRRRLPELVDRLWVSQGMALLAHHHPRLRLAAGTEERS